MVLADCEFLGEFYFNKLSLEEKVFDYSIFSSRGRRGSDSHSIESF